MCIRAQAQRVHMHDIHDLCECPSRMLYYNKNLVCVGCSNALRDKGVGSLSEKQA